MIFEKRKIFNSIFQSPYGNWQINTLFYFYVHTINAQTICIFNSPEINSNKNSIKILEIIHS